MGVTSGIVVYVISWWLVFFMTLPIGVRPPHEAGEQVESGNEPGAPVAPKLWVKALAATIIAAVIWGIIYWVIEADIVSFRPG